MRFKSISVLVISLGIPCLGRPHPVSYKGAVSVMSWNQAAATDWMTTYTFSRDMAVAGRHLRLDTEAGVLRADLAQLNARLKRWNALDSQANVYLSGGGGRATRGKTVSSASFASLVADHESRRHLLLAEGSVLTPGQGPAVYRWEARAGLAPYLSRFDEPSGWLILSLQGAPQTKRAVTLTPMIRVFYRNVLGEVGAGTGGDWMFNFMVHY